MVTDVAEQSRRGADAATVAALRARDEAAFRRLVEEFNPGLTRLARTYVSKALADEVVQETWTAVIGSIDEFEGRSSLKTWIYRILLNKVRTLAGREAKVVPFAAFSRADDGATVEQIIELDRFERAGPDVGDWLSPPIRWEGLPAERLEAAEVRDMIREAIAALPPAQREVVELRDIQGWTSTEVSETLGITSVNQRVLLHRGRAAVRTMLEEYFDDV